MGSKLHEHTEQTMLGLLRRRYTGDSGNGPQAIFATHVRSAAGFDSRRTLDGVAMGLWPSRGLRLLGFEVKCSRSDVMAELKNAEKAEEFVPKLDMFYLVVAHPSLVKVEEVPEMWGLLAAKGDKIHELKAATLLHHDPERIGRFAPLPEGFDRSFLAALLRSVSVSAGAVKAPERERWRREGYDTAMREVERRKSGRDGRLERLEEAVEKFKEASGIDLMSTRWDAPDAAKVGEVVWRVLEGEKVLESVSRHLEAAARSGAATDSLAREALGRLRCGHDD